MSRTTIVGCWGMLLAACATHAPVAPQRANALNQVSCRFAGIESVQGPSDSDADSVSLLAVYRFADSGTTSPAQPLALKFVVSRSRVDELRDHLSARPEVVCTPDAEANYTAQVEPFEGIPGIPHR